MRNLGSLILALTLCAAIPPVRHPALRGGAGGGYVEAPCDAVFDVDYTKTRTEGAGREAVTTTEHVHISGMVAGTLSMNEQGDDDYYMGLGSGQGKGSTYTFGPEPGTLQRMAYRKDWSREGPEYLKCDGKVIANGPSIGGLSMSMVTTGRGDLLFTRGGIQFVRDSARASETDRGWDIGTEGGTTRIEAISSSSKTSVTEAVTCFWAEQQYSADPGKATPEPAFQISRSALRQAILSGKPEEASGKGAYDLPLGDGVHISGTTKVTLRIRPPHFEAILEPADSGYADWIPEGPSPGGASKRGNQLSLRVRLVERGHPEKCVKGILHETVFRLVDVSQQPGDCMNHPKKDPDQDFDLRFEAEANPKGIVEDCGRALRVSGSPDEDLAVVSCFDYGAYGKVIAEVKVAGQTLRARPIGEDGRLYLSIPEDDNENHIADKWEDQYHILEENLPATWDEEDQPHWNTGKGDGLTLYEEYRGFILDVGGVRKHVSLRPKVRHLFVLPLGAMKGTYIDAASVFGAAAGLDVLVVDEEGVDDDGLKLREDEYTLVKPHWVNFRSKVDDGVDFGPRQYAVRIETDDTLEDASAQTVFLQEDLKPRCPGRVARIRVSGKVIGERLLGDANWMHHLDPVKDAPAIAYFTARGIDPVKAAEETLKNASSLMPRYAGFTVIHELGHCLDLPHHAEKDESMAKAAMKNKVGCERYAPGQTAFTFFRQGDPLCPMRYWRTADPEDLYYGIPFDLKAWDPSTVAWQRPEAIPEGELPPAGPPSLGAPAPWALCGECQPRLRLKP